MNEQELLPPQNKSEEDLDLEFARKIRKDLVTDIVKDGIPTDNRERRILLEALDGIDNSALQRKKIQVDTDSANNTLIAVNTIAEIFMTKNVKELGANELLNGTIHELESSIPDSPVVEGELGDNVNITYEEFMMKMDPTYEK